jgi:vacuolar iron transporter family protein
MEEIESRRASMESKGRIREFVFGIQDGTMSTVGLLAGMQGATDRRSLVVLAGITAVMSGAISMAAGAYLSARAEKDIVDHERDQAAQLATAEPYVAQEGILEVLVKEGLAREQAFRVVKLLSGERRVLLSTFSEKVFGLAVSDLNQPLKGALVMALSFILGGGLPMIPYVMMSGPAALITSAVVGAAVLFAVGAFKGKLAGQPPMRSATGFCVIAVVAATAGYVIGLAADRLVPGAAAAAASGG